MKFKKISRRSLLKSAALAAGALSGFGPLVLLPRKGQAAADKGPIVFCTYGGPYGENMQKHVIDPFVRKTGIQVIRTSTPNFAKVKAMVDIGNVEWDVVDAETRLFYRGVRGSMFHRLDWSVVGHRDELVPGAVEPMGAANVYYSSTLAWSKKKFSAQNAPRGWQDFVRFPGKKSLRGEAWATMEIGLMGSGVPADRLYPLDAERSLKTLSKVKAQTIFWKKTKMALDLFVSGEVDLGHIGAGPVLRAIEEGEPLDFTWNQALQSRDYLSIPRGSKQVEAAMKFIGHCLDPEIQSQYSIHYAIGPSNMKAFQFIPKERFRFLPTSPDNLSLAANLDGKYWAEHEPELAKRFDQWMVS